MNGHSLDFATRDLSSPGDASPELMKLSAEQQELLTEILDRYMKAQEQGLPLDQEALLADRQRMSLLRRGT